MKKVKENKMNTPSAVNHSEKRYEFLDLLRGIMMISMMVLHLLYDLYDLFGMNIALFGTTGLWYWEQITAGTFIFLCGVSCNFSRNNVKRGVRLLLWGAVITLVTLCIGLIEPIFKGIFIQYGILTCLGCCCILLGFFKDKIWDRINAPAGAVVSIVLYLFTRGVCMCQTGVAETGSFRGFLGIERLPLIWLPEQLYSYEGLELLGFSTENFSSADYFPLIPFFFLFIFGFFTWKVIKNTKPIVKISRLSIPPVNFIGRKSIWFYLLHQPVFIVIIGTVYLFTGQLF